MFVELMFNAKYVVLKGLILQLPESGTVFDLKSAIKRVLDISVEDLELATIYGKTENSEKVLVLFSENASLRLLKQGKIIASVTLYTLVNAEPQTRSSQATLEMSAEVSVVPSNSSLSLSSSVLRIRSEEPKMHTKMPSGKGFRDLNLMAKHKSEPMDVEDEEDVDEESEVWNTSTESGCPDRRRVCCDPTKCNNPDTRPPYAKTPPENRQFAVMITNDDYGADVDIQAIMAHLFSLFEECPVFNLDFSNCVPMSRSENWLMFVTNDYNSSDWVIDAIAGVCPPHSCLPFIQFFGLVRAHFVLPLAAPGKQLCSIFQLFEDQNCGLVTHQWAVIGRYMLDPCDSGYTNKVVSTLNENEEIDLFLDAASRDFILEQCGKVKYCFWHLSFCFP